MNILFVTFGDLSIGSGAHRSLSILRALADAGHHIDVIAAGAQLYQLEALTRDLDSVFREVNSNGD